MKFNIDPANSLRLCGKKLETRHQVKSSVQYQVALSDLRLTHERSDWTPERIIRVPYQWELPNNIMKSGCTRRGFEIYDYLMRFDMNEKDKPCSTAAVSA